MGRMLVIVLLPALVWAREADISTAPSTSPGTFLRTVDGRLISLRAQEASIKALLEEVGRRMGIEVIANISRAQTLTLAFDRLTVEDAIERFRQYTNIVYVTDAQGAHAQLRRIIALPMQEGTSAVTDWNHVNGYVLPLLLREKVE